MKTNSVLDPVTVKEMNFNQKLKNFQTFNIRRFKVSKSVRPIR
jgi:hypothetical protein